MTIREFYERTGGDYAGVMGRFENESRIRRFVGMFPEDQSYNCLEQALEDQKRKDAFLAAHTLKGVCLNLGFSRLHDSASAVTEALRREELTAAGALMPALRDDYRALVETIQKL